MSFSIKSRQRLLLSLIAKTSAVSAFSSLAIIDQPALAFKLNTHAKLAEIVYEDAKDGQITIRVYVEPGSKAAKDQSLRQVRSFAEGRAGIEYQCNESDTNKPKVKAGPPNQWPQYGSLNSRETCYVKLSYPVANVYRQALNSTNGFNAFIQGSLGPDVYPDMLTGQKIIHPHEGAHDATTAQWLAKVYWMARENKNAIKDSSNLAFALGYTFHAIADTYAHTLVNKYAGGPFAMGENAVRHIIVEGTIGKFLPDPSPQTLAARLNQANLGFVYDSLVKSGRDEANMYSDRNPNTDYSIPFVFESLRLDLSGDEKTYRRRSKNCSWYDPTCSSVANNIKAAYVDAWQKDIVIGLKSWPGVSQKAGIYLGFNSTGKLQGDNLQTLYSDYAVNHLLSMSGAPDALGYTISAIGNLAELVTPEWIQEKIREMKRDLANYILREATGKSISQWQAVLKQEAKDVVTIRSINSLRQSDGMLSASDGNSFIAVNEMWSEGGQVTSDPDYIYNSPWFHGSVQLGKTLLLSRADLDNLTKWINQNACAGRNCYLNVKYNEAQQLDFVTPIWWASKTNCSGNTAFPVYGRLCAGGVASIDDPSGMDRRGSGTWNKPWFIKALFAYVGPIPAIGISSSTSPEGTPNAQPPAGTSTPGNSNQDSACANPKTDMGLWSFKDPATNKYARGGVTAEGRNDLVGALGTAVTNPSRAWESFRLYSIPGVEGGRRLQNTIDGRWLEIVNNTSTLLLRGPVRSCSTSTKEMQWRVVPVAGQRGYYKLQSLRTNQFVKVAPGGLLKANATEAQATAFGSKKY